MLIRVIISHIIQFNHIATLVVCIILNSPSDQAKRLVKIAYVHVENNIKSDWKWTPLHYACEGNNAELVKLLLDYGAGELLPISQYDCFA